MLPAREMVLTVLDFEGTGAVRGYPDEPWQIGLIQIRAGRVAAGSAYESLLHVGERPFNRYAPGRHAELRQALKLAPDLSTLWPALRPYLEGIPLVAHNAATEKRYLTGAFALHRVVAWIDTLKLTRLAYPALRSHKLDDVLLDLALRDRVAQMVPGREPHDALYDAIGCAMVLCHLLEQPGWRDMTLADLLHLQRRRDAPH